MGSENDIERSFHGGIYYSLATVVCTCVYSIDRSIDRPTNRLVLPDSWNPKLPTFPRPSTPNPSPDESQRSYVLRPAKITKGNSDICHNFSTAHFCLHADPNKSRKARASQPFRLFHVVPLCFACVRSVSSRVCSGKECIGTDKIGLTSCSQRPPQRRCFDEKVSTLL